MNIIITDKKVTIEQNGLSSTHNVGSLRYHIAPERDSVTLKEEGFSVTSPINQIMVNGEQMTSDNIELLLDTIFFSADNGGDGVKTYDTLSQLPYPGESGSLYITTDTGNAYIWDDNDYLQVGGVFLSPITGQATTYTMTQKAITDLIAQTGSGNLNKIAIGNGTNCNAPNYGTAIGPSATVDANNYQVAIGYSSSAQGGIYNVAIGGGRTSDVANSIAIGRDTTVTDNNSIALGFYSQALASDRLSTDPVNGGVVSFGRTSDEKYHKRIINIVDGVNESDAATVGQTLHYDSDGNVQLREDAKILGTNIELVASEEVTVNSNGLNATSQGDISIFADNGSTVKIESDVVRINSSGMFDVNGGDINLNVPAGCLGMFTQVTNDGKDATLFFNNGDCSLSTNNAIMDNGIQLTNGGEVLLYNYLENKNIRLSTSGGKAYYTTDDSTLNDSYEIATIGNLNTKQNIVNYSDSEVSTGETWYDGSIIYRKVLSWQIQGSDTTYYIPHNIEDFSTAVRLDVFQTAGSSISKLPIFTSSGIMKLTAGMDSTDLIISTDGSSISYPHGYGHAIIEYTKMI